jgi:hypothetical protein
MCDTIRLLGKDMEYLLWELRYHPRGHTMATIVVVKYVAAPGPRSQALPCRRRRHAEANVVRLSARYKGRYPELCQPLPCSTSRQKIGTEHRYNQLAKFKTNV